MSTPVATALTAPALYAITTGTIFGARNAKKVDEGDLGRLPVTIGQGAKVINSIFDQVEVFDKMAKSENALVSGSAKALNFAKNNINNFIVASSAVKFLNAAPKDKKDIAITEGGGLAGMFAIEGWMKEHLDDAAFKLFKKFSKGEIDIDSLKNKKWYPFVKGLTFVTASITCSDLGTRIGKEIAKEVPNPVA